jgi:hypothetical protein
VEERFSTPVQPGPEAHPASYTMGTGSFPGIKRPGSGVNHPLLSIAKVKEIVELYFYSLSVPLLPVLGRTLLLHAHLIPKAATVTVTSINRLKTSELYADKQVQYRILSPL